ncbi:MAG: hypothetical protein HY885_16620 [Deltaproteobacteria bacterium]|nr:hypothetical protein [Deltaproteobacteria bacterium]
MKKTIRILLSAIIVAFAASGPLYAASGQCTVVAIEKNKVILDCGSNSGEFKVGDEVKMKSVSKKGVEGC